MYRGQSAVRRCHVQIRSSHVTVGMLTVVNELPGGCCAFKNWNPLFWASLWAHGKPQPFSNALGLRRGPLKIVRPIPNEKWCIKSFKICSRDHPENKWFVLHIRITTHFPTRVLFINGPKSMVIEVMSLQPWRRPCNLIDRRYRQQSVLLGMVNNC